MTFLVVDNCIKCKHTDCVSVCPVDCFYEGDDVLVINPDECIDCGICLPECPIDAIKADTDTDFDVQFWTEFNGQHAKIWPNITVKKDPLVGWEEWDGVPDKIKLINL